MITIDGSILEGGGQILRMSVSLSALTGIPIMIEKIRANRPKGGLARQHLVGINLLTAMCSATAEGAYLGSTSFKFKPNKLKGGIYKADVGTAGSIALVLQTVLPVSYFCNSSVTFDLTGGTNALFAPQIDFFTEIFRPNLEKFGASFEFELHKRGYFPKGGGRCVVEVTPIHHFDPVTIYDMGQIEDIFGWSFVSGMVPMNIGEEMARGAKSLFKKENIRPSKTTSIEVYKEIPEMTVANCSGIILGASTTTNCIIGGSALGARNVNDSDTGANAAMEIADIVRAEACVDSHVQDQLIIFMALANGKSRIRTTKLTQHTLTAIHVAELITKVKFIINEEEKNVTIECVGMGLENKHLKK